MHPQKGFLAIGLQNLLLCFFIFVSIIPVLFLGSWVYNHALETELAAAAEKHLLLADNISGALDSYTDDLKSVFRTKSEGSPEFLTAESEVLLQSVNIQMLALAMPGGALDYYLGNENFLPANGLAELLTTKRKALARPKEVMVSPVILNVRQVPMLYLLRVTRDNRLAIAAVNTASIKKIQRRVEFGENGYSVIVDQAGQVIAHPDWQWEEAVKDLSTLKPVKLIAAQSRGVVEFYSSSMKAATIAGYSPVPDTDWGIIVAQPYIEVTARARRTKVAALWVSGLGLLLAVLVSWQLTRYILRPIDALMRASQALETGKTVGSLAVEQPMMPKEMYRLLRAFEHMAAEVSTVRTTLEQRVEERTHELIAEVERRKQLEEQLLKQATHDALTGLPNRRLLEGQLQSALALAKRSQKLSALFFLDLDGFKPINDTYGHQVGDKLLIQVSQRLTQSLRGSDRVFRIGGDEFVILIYQADSTDAIKQLSDKILMVMREPFHINDYVVNIGSSIGIKVSNACRNESLSQILAEADVAMYRAKETGNCAILYEECMVS